MKYGVYSIRDELTTFMSPFIESTDESAIRAFRNACADKSTMFYANPADFSLYRVAYFDNTDGVIDGSLNNMELLVRGDSIVQNEV